MRPALQASYFEEISCRKERISRKFAAAHAYTGSASAWPPPAAGRFWPRAAPVGAYAWPSSHVTLKRKTGTASDPLPAGPTGRDTSMQRRFRLNRSGDIQRVRRTGKSYAHPLLVLVAARSDAPSKRLAVTAGLRVGGAVERNRARRRIREAARPLVDGMPEGWDLLLIARSGAVKAPFGELAGAVRTLFQRAGVTASDDRD
jgi:ribonuclease P protein component